MSSFEIKYKVGREDYDTVVDKFYTRFLGELQYELINSDNPLNDAKERLQFWQIILFGNAEMDKEIQKQFSTKFIDSEELKKHVNDLLSGKEELLLKGKNTDIAILGASKGVIFLVEEIKKIISDIIHNGKFQKPNLELGKETTLKFKNYIDSYADTFYQWLIASYEVRMIDSTQISQTHTEIDFIKNEVKNFNWFLGIDKANEANAYLMKRLEFKSLSDLLSLREVAIELKAGNYMEILSSFIFDKQILAGKILAIKRYFEFLKNKAFNTDNQDSDEKARNKKGRKATASPIISFKWRGVQTHKRDGLFVLLSTGDDAMIDKETDPDDFVKAFSGVEIKKPLNIKWKVVGRNNKTSKMSLFYFLNKLIEKKFIEGPVSNIEYSNQVEMIFADESGKKLDHLTTSCSAAKKSKKSPSRGYEINQIVQDLSL